MNADVKSFVKALSLPARTVSWLGRESREMAPAVVFFLAGFGFILILIKLFVAQYAIEFPVISRAVLGALIAAKATLVLDKIGWGRTRGYPGAVIVAARTTLYSAVAILLGIAERLVDGLRATGSMEGAFVRFHERFNASRFFAIVLCVSALFAVYFMLREINQRLGKRALYSIFFEAPRDSAIGSPTR
jgi:hypothetical protein